jgi:hypothetical protein
MEAITTVGVCIGLTLAALVMDALAIRRLARAARRAAAQAEAEHDEAPTTQAGGQE